MQRNTPITIYNPTSIRLRSSRARNKKVLMGQGLCIGIYDITEIGDAEVRCGTGVPVLSVVFRVIVFGPFIGEVLSGVVASVDEHGVRVSLGFSADVIIPCEMFQQPAEYVPHSQTWVCTFINELEDGTKAPQPSPPQHHTVFICMT